MYGRGEPADPPPHEPPPMPEWAQHDALCQHRRSQGIMRCDCPHGRMVAAAQAGPVPEDSAAPRPMMISFDLPTGQTIMAPRCCAQPVPQASATARGKGDRPWHCDLTCASCGAGLAVLRWRL
jgi:hypothetical protein